mmetsp:Transcript_4873/g.14771  ORF Transcript_4873/g.14771 Transcript_4873/m.14771 type:complete len:187 (-) Transcript_4873:123-683(-)
MRGLRLQGTTDARSSGLRSLGVRRPGGARRSKSWLVERVHSLVAAAPSSRGDAAAAALDLSVATSRGDVAARPRDADIPRRRRAAACDRRRRSPGRGSPPTCVMPQVQQTLEALDFVASASVDLKAGEATCTLKDGGAARGEELVAALKAASYEVTACGSGSGKPCPAVAAGTCTCGPLCERGARW